MGIIYTLAFCGAVLGVALVVFWCVRNDSPEAGRPTTGWLAMRDADTDVDTADQHRRKVRRHGFPLSRPGRNV